MNWVTSTFRNLQQKISKRFLLIFSILSFATFGFVLACGWYEEETYSVFNANYFAKDPYSPFFIRVKDAHDPSDPLVTEWYDYLKHKLTKEETTALIYQGTVSRLDSVYRYLSGNKPEAPVSFPGSIKGKLTGGDLKKLHDYFLLAKQCEKFADMPEREPWSEKPDSIVIPDGLPTALSKAFDKEKDGFIKQRLWFQLVRMKYFEDRIKPTADTIDVTELQKSDLYQSFNRYQNSFPKNLIYYRTLGYLAGYYYLHKEYAQANYLYSLCYAYTYTTNDLQISSNWSFHPQEEADWRETLHLAKNNEEKITLWYMLGLQNDPARAIKEIAALNPASDKMGALLGRLVNSLESDPNEFNSNAKAVADTTAHTIFSFDNSRAGLDFASKYNDSSYLAAYKTALAKIVPTEPNVHLVDSLSNGKLIYKPWYWHLAAGYLHYLNYDFNGAAKFYALAQPELPKDDKQITAQYKLLIILLKVHQLGHIYTKTENSLVEPLTWLANLRDDKEIIKDLPYQDALTAAAKAIAHAYVKQGNSVKAMLFANEDNNFYGSFKSIDSVINFIDKSNKTPFELAMLRYYPIKKEQLYYQQALIETCLQNTGHAIALMAKSGDVIKDEALYGNPFDNRLKDCHDCDFSAPQKRSYTRLTFLQTLKTISDDLRAGKAVYRNTYLLGNAYYNLSKYGNATHFYDQSVTGTNASYDTSVSTDTASSAISISPQVAEEYYKKALKYAINNEQRARCTFMLAKCERNEYYDTGGTDVFAGNHLKNLKINYAKTTYYAEVLKECGYFKLYLSGEK